MGYAHNRVCFTKGILHKYGDTQAGIERLAGVAAHEIGHLRNWDTRINMLLHYLTLPVNFVIGLANATINRIPIIGLIFTLATVVFRLPCDIAHFLNGSTSQFQEYQADRFAGKLMNGVGISEFLDDISHMSQLPGDKFSDWLMRTHSPTELRHDELADTFAAALSRQSPNDRETKMADWLDVWSSLGREQGLELDILEPVRLTVGGQKILSS